MPGRNNGHPRDLIQHNSDLHPDTTFLSRHAPLRTLLLHGALQQQFAQHDRTAARGHLAFSSLGLASLTCLALYLTGALSVIVLTSGHAPQPPAYSPTLARLAIEVLGLLPATLALAAWLARAKDRWLTARFFAERIRQWHFTLFLDGALVSKLSYDEAGFRAERDKRWASLLQDLRAGSAHMRTFMSSNDYPSAHPRTPFTNTAIAHEIFPAYVKLRFEWQLAYFKHKANSLTQKDDWTGAIAKWTLLAAALTPLLQLALYGLGPATPTYAMPALALLFALASAITRVLRGALAYSEERERYQSKWNRVLALKSAFDATPTTDGRLALMHDLENMAIEELREFLRTMNRATYLL